MPMFGPKAAACAAVALAAGLMAAGGPAAGNSNGAIARATWGESLQDGAVSRDVGKRLAQGPIIMPPPAPPGGGPGPMPMPGGPPPGGPPGGPAPMPPPQS